MKKYLSVISIVVALMFSSCGEHQHHHEMQTRYVCPMFCDSLLYNKPGQCTVCGMDLIKQDSVQKKEISKIYTCPMHPEIIRDASGPCPICGMDLVEKMPVTDSVSIDPGMTVEPVSQVVLSQIKTIKPEKKSIEEELNVNGFITYNPENAFDVSSRYNGRIEKLYVKYNYQEVVKGQKLMDVYSPELVTAQQEYVFLLNNHSEMEMIYAAIQKLSLLGFNDAQIRQIAVSRKAERTLSVYAPIAGHIHQMSELSELTMPTMPMNKNADAMSSKKEFSIRQGMYVKKGEVVFNIISLSKIWVILKLYPEDISKIKVGQKVTIKSEMAPDNILSAKISFIEPVLDKDSRFVSARVYVEKCDHHVFKIGSLVSASVAIPGIEALWIPATAIMNAGNSNYVVFKQEEHYFKAHSVRIGNRIGNEVQILEGISTEDKIASNASFMVDSESFVQIN